MLTRLLYSDNVCWFTVASVSDVTVSSTVSTSLYQCIIPVAFKRDLQLIWTGSNMNSSCGWDRIVNQLKYFFMFACCC